MVDDDAFADELETVRFLTQATFGPTRQDIEDLTGTSASEWFIAQVNAEPSLLTPTMEYYMRLGAQSVPGGEDGPGARGAFNFQSISFAAWRNFFEGPDQLRQRMAYALSQLFVVSNATVEELVEQPQSVAAFEDNLIAGAFGNYRDLLEEVTYSTAMGVYLTYMFNSRANPDTGRVPDENYAREILQLFSIGVVLLNPDGTPALGAEGQPQETYTNQDITELAKVFTGLGLVLGEPDCWSCPMTTYEEWGLYETEPKTFLGQTIPADTPIRDNITQALDIIFAHPNVGPFVSRQLIQRFVTSNPTPAYVERVSTAFDTGSFELPNEAVVGTGERGDLEATLAAILFDPEARSELARQDPQFGKIREPLLRLTHWVRAFHGNVPSTPEYFLPLWSPDFLWNYSQDPYKAPSVFNFYRPGYVPAGTLSGAAGMTVPEFQITHVSSIPSDANVLYGLMFRNPNNPDEFFLEGLDQYWSELFNYVPDHADVQRTFASDYSAELALVSDLAALIDDLDRFLCYGTMMEETKQEIQDILEVVVDDIPTGEDYRYALAGDELRVRLAVYLVMTSADYVVQR